MRLRGACGHSPLADATSHDQNLRTARLGHGALEFIDIYAGLTDNELRRFRQRHPEQGSIVTGFFQQAREEGLEQGIEQGLEQGLERGMRQGRAEGERLVLDAETLDGVFRPTRA